MGGNDMKRKLAVLLTFFMVVSMVFSSGFIKAAHAAEPVDEYSWNFSDMQVGHAFTDNIAAETQNTVGRGTLSYANIAHKPFTALSSSGTAATGSEGASQILVDNQSSKWCNTSTTASNAWFVLDAGEQIKTKSYAIRGANDDMGYTGRVLHTWTIEGSNSASGPWTNISSPGAQGAGWNANYQLRLFDFDSANIPEEGFRYYRLQITRRDNSAAGTALGTSGTTMQFSYFGLVTGYDIIGFAGETNYLLPLIAENPQAMRDGSATPWNGPMVLNVNGNTTGTGSGTIDAKSYTRIRTGLNIAVHKDTRLSYLINPQSGGTYDFKLTSCHSALDLKFTDGTRLSQLPVKAQDIYGFDLTPIAQGQARTYHVDSWNYVESNIGKVAEGKIIEEILVGFEMPNAPKNIIVRQAFDDINIFRRDDTELIRNTAIADFTDIRQGTRVGDYGNGAMSPLVGTPNPFNYWVPCTVTGTGSPYNSQDRSFRYIRISHLASRWMGERGTMTFMADAVTAPGGAASTAASSFVKANEFAAHSYHYGVKFNDTDARNPGVSVEVTPTAHAAVLRFTFPATAAERNIAISGTAVAAVLSGNSFTTRDNTNSSGMRNMQVYGEFSATPTTFAAATTSTLASFPALGNGPNGSTVIEMKVATSFMSPAQAKKNMQLEIADSDWFDAVCAKTKEIWNKTLGTVKIEDADANYWDMVDFYSKFARTNMYPTIMHENTNPSEDIAECNAEPKWQYVSPYRGSNANLVIRDGYFSYNEGFWDTFRSKWTALGFFRPAATGPLFDGVVNHFIDQDTRGSFAIPRWINPAGSNLMVMTSSDVIATELYARGVNYDYKNGYDAALKSSTVYGPTSGTQGGRFGIQTSIFKGYTPWGTAPAAGGGGQLDTSWALEGFTNDAGLSKMAAGMRDEALQAGDAALARTYNDEYLYFQNRAKYYTNHFNATNTGSVNSPGWMMNKNSAGQWLGGNGSTTTAFNALDWGWGFCEDNAYQYTVSAPQDGRGLANLYGGMEAFGEKMEHIFANSSWDGVAIRGGGYGGAIHEAYEKREVKIGQWGLSNEPSEHMSYMWLFTDKPEESFRYTRMGMLQAYGSGQIGRGYMGEEDNGSMASWYVWAALGMYPLDPGSGTVVVGSPKFKNVTYTLDDGRVFTISAPNASPKNVYTNGLKVNGQPYNKLYFPQDLFRNGTVIEFDMGATPNGWALSAEQPPSLTEGDGVEYEPDILMDIIPEGVSRVTALPESTATTDQAFVSGVTADNAAYLFDNISTTAEAQFEGTTGTITYYSATPVKVEMYTLTSSNTSGADPKSWTLSGSNDGTVWNELDARTLPNLSTYNNVANSNGPDADMKDTETFRWRRQTKPFAIEAAKQATYKYYRLEITASSSEEPLRLAEFELLADQYFKVDKTALLQAITAAEIIKADQEAGPVYGAPEYDVLLAELIHGKTVYDDPAAVGRMIKASTNKINAAIAALIKIRKASVPFDATGYNQGTSAEIKAETSTPTAGSDIPLATIPNIGGSFNGAIVAYKYIDFGDGVFDYTRARATYAGNTADCNGAHMVVHLDSPNGPIIADISTPPTAEGTSWSVYKYGYGEVVSKNIFGVHDVYFELLNGGGNHVANVYQFVFEGKAVDWYVDPVTVTEVDDITTITARVKNNTTNATNVNLIAAVYTAEGQLVSVQVTNAPVDAGTWQTFAPLALDLTDVAAGYSIKLFAWDAAGTPLTEPVIIK